MENLSVTIAKLLVTLFRLYSDN